MIKPKNLKFQHDRLIMVKYDLFFVFCVIYSCALLVASDEDDLEVSQTTTGAQATLDIKFKLQQIYLPLDGISATFTSPVADSWLTAVFPKRAVVRTAPPRQGSVRAILLDGITQYGFLKGAFDWIYDLEKSPTGITILLYFQLPVAAAGPAYLLSVGDRTTDPANAAGFDILVNSATSNVEIRFGYRTYDWKCVCGGESGTAGIWHAVHASCRNYFGLLQCSMAVDGLACSDAEDGSCAILEHTPNYDASRIDTLYIGAQNPKTESFSAMILDEIRIFNIYTEVDTAMALKDNPDENISNVAQEKCCTAGDRNTDVSCLARCSARKIKTLFQMENQMKIDDGCADQDECVTEPCAGSCVNQNGSFQCHCPDGLFLSTDKSSCDDHCTGVVCQINARCFSTEEKFKCGCDFVSRGEMCQEKVDLCSPNPCQNGGTCTNPPNTFNFICICHKDFVGERCEEEITDCARQPCRHGGTCVLTDDDVGYKCICKEEYSGAVCENVFNHCLAMKCANSATCTVKDDKAVCECVGDFVGEFCEESSHPCKPNPCRHGSTCTPNGLLANCNCLPGFTGIRCETDIDECSLKEPCDKKAFCTNTNGSFFCSCPNPGFALPDCVLSIDLCRSNPCQNNATCINSPGKYRCNCPPGFLGQNCDVVGVDRVTVTASESQVVAGREVIYIIQCAHLGDEPTFYMNMGDRFYFYATTPILQKNASNFILEKTGVKMELENPVDRFVFIYVHWFSRPDDLALTVEVFNRKIPSSKFIKIVRVEKRNDFCFPEISIVNGGFNLSTAPQFQHSRSFVIQSVVKVKSECEERKNLFFNWTIYKLTKNQPIPFSENIQILPENISTNKPFLEIGERILPYGSYMNELKVTVMKNFNSSIVNLDRGWFNITTTPLKVSIKGGAKRSAGNTDLILDGSASIDPDTNSKIMNYYWFGYKDVDAPENLPENITTAVAATSFPDSGCLQDHSEAIAILSGAQRPKPGKYIFQLVGEVLRNDQIPAIVHRGVAVQEVTVFDKPYPNLEISCIKTNCAVRIDAGERFSLEAKCENCDTGSTYLWTVSSTTDEKLNENIWEKNMEFNKTEKMLAVRHETLPTDPNAVYTFAITVTQPDGSDATAEYSVQVNQPPIKGTCTVDPLEGFGLETFFTVNCKDFTDDDLPLTYRFHYLNGDEVIAADNDASGNEGILLYYNVDPQMPETFLPNGLPANNYSGKLLIIVHDALEAITQVTVNVTVRPRNRTAAELVEKFNEMMDPNGILQQNIDAGNHQGTAQLAVAISTQLNRMSDDGIADPAMDSLDKVKIRGQLVEALDKLPIHSLSALQQVAASVSQVVARSDQVSQTAQLQSGSAILLKTLGESLSSQIGDHGVGPFELEETAAYLVSAVTNVIGAIAERAEHSHSQRRRRAVGNDVTLPESTQAKNDSANCVSVLKKVIETFGATKLVGENPTEFSTPKLHVAVSQLNPEDVQMKFSKSSMKDVFHLPEDLNFGSDPVQVQTLFSQNNLYSWDPASVDINTPSVDLSFTDPKTGSNLDFTNLTKPIHIVLPLKVGSDLDGLETEKELWTLAMPAEFYSSMNLSLQNVTVSPEKTIVVRISAQNLRHPLSVLISEGVKPSLEDFAQDDLVGTMDALPSNVTDARVERYFQLPAKKRNGTETTCYVAVAAGDIWAYRDQTIEKSVDDPPEGSVVNVTFNISIFSAVCLYWKETEQTWKSDGCEVSNQTTQTELHCDCNHLTTFAAGLFIQPNKLDPIDVATLHLVFFQNPVVICTVAVIWVLYLSLLVYARRLDAAEEAKRGVHILTDNDASHQYYYVVTVSTGLRFGATTTAKVGVMLKGLTDQSDPHILNQIPNMEFFQMGSEDSFLIAVSDCLGDLMVMSIWQNGEGIHPAWFVDKVLVRDVQTNQLFFFLPNRWLAANKADGLLSAEILVADSENLKNFWHRFVCFVNRGLRENHLYFSVVFRPSRSNFTRRQRLTCILSLLLTTMLASIMFFQIEKPIKNPKDQRSFHGFSFNWNQIKLGIQSGFMVLPINVVVIQCFVNASSKKGEKKVEKKDIPKGGRNFSQLSKTFLNSALANLIQSESDDDIFRQFPKENWVENSAFISPINHRFPYWTKYVAWCVGLGSALVASFYVTRYGIQYGRTRSEEFLVTFFSAFFQDVFVTQPLKVFAISFLVVLFLKKPLEKEAEGSVISCPKLPIDVSNSRDEFRYKPASLEWVEAIRKIAILTKRMNQWILDIFWFLVFIISVFIFTYGNTPIGGYGIRRTLETSYQLPSGPNDDGAKIDGFMDVSDVKGMWAYLNNKFIEAHCPEIVPRRGLGKKTGHYISDFVNIALGPARLRQVRIRREECSLDERVAMLKMTCLPAYSHFLHETRTFDAGWVFPDRKTNATNETASNQADFEEEDPVADESEVDYSSEEEEEEETTSFNLKTSSKKVSDSSTKVSSSSKQSSSSSLQPWKYQSSAELGMGAYIGELTTYQGGGYVAVLPQNATANSDVFHELEEIGWIDDLTRAVFLQMNFFNPNTNLFTIAILLFEFHPSGKIVPFFTIDTIRLFISDKKLNNLTNGFGIFSAFLLIVFTFNIFRHVVSQKLKFFKHSWNYLDISIITMGWMTFALHFLSRRTKSAAINLVKKADPGHFVGFYFAMINDSTLVNLAAFFLFICTMKLLKILGILRKINTFLYVLSEISGPFFGFCVSFFISVMPFIMAGHVIFGRSLKRNSSFSSSFVTILRFFIVDTVPFFQEFSGVEAVLGPFYFIAAVFSILFVYANILLSLILVGFSRTIFRHKEKIQCDAELADFVLQKIQKFFGFRLRRPVVDLSKFPAATEFRQSEKIRKRFEEKPKLVEANDWSNLLNLAEIRKMTQIVAKDIRDIQLRAEPKNQFRTDFVQPRGSGPRTEPKTEFRTDFSIFTNEFFFVETLPLNAVSGPGPTTNPINSVTPVKNVMEEVENESNNFDLVDLDFQIKKNIDIFRKMLIAAKFSVIFQLESSNKKIESNPLRKRSRSKD